MPKILSNAVTRPALGRAVFIATFIVSITFTDSNKAQSSDADSSVKNTANPTGLQLGLTDPDAGKLPPGTEELAREGALASADLDWEGAKKAYSAMLKKAPNSALALSNLGAVEFRLGNLDTAAQHLERATLLKPTIGQNWLTLGLIYREQNRNYKSVAALARAVDVDSSDPRGHNYLGVAIRELGWIQGAETELQRALALDPGYADAHFNLAIMYLDRSPPLLELARRHYYAAVDYGAKPDKDIERKLTAKPEGE